jgi:hypothetical protein
LLRPTRIGQVRSSSKFKMSFSMTSPSRPPVATLYGLKLASIPMALMRFVTNEHQLNRALSGMAQRASWTRDMGNPIYMPPDTGPLCLDSPPSEHTEKEGNRDHRVSALSAIQVTLGSGRLFCTRSHGVHGLGSMVQCKSIN